ncbi:hypothetical protein GDO81_029535 [Engystomops pustulosus]|uniref:Secreted protein n=1 Tax=Engystomops pustulosus TaxID=76066 RepID=A0AAV6YDI4_ENGPU|nr:hypothetical protein GDO81_029535 [Engystomops pustulosus]
MRMTVVVRRLPLSLWWRLLCRGHLPAHCCSITDVECDSGGVECVCVVGQGMLGAVVLHQMDISCMCLLLHCCTDIRGSTSLRSFGPQIRGSGTSIPTSNNSHRTSEAALIREH